VVWGIQISIRGPNDFVGLLGAEPGHPQGAGRPGLRAGRKEKRQEWDGGTRNYSFFLETCNRFSDFPWVGKVASRKGRGCACQPR